MGFVHTSTVELRPPDPSMRQSASVEALLSAQIWLRICEKNFVDFKTQHRIQLNIGTYLSHGQKCVKCVVFTTYTL